MKLLTFTANEGPRLGARTVDGAIADLNRAYSAYRLANGEPISEQRSTCELPSDMVAFLEAGSPALEAARRALDFVEHANRREVHGPWGSRVVYGESEVRLLSPVVRPSKIIGIGLNYRDHAEEQGSKIPKVPMIFAKFSTSLIGASEPIVYPAITQQLDYEAELAFVIGRQCKDVPAEDAYRYIAGYTVFNDVTARDVQLGDRQWLRGKTPDRITPVGPHLVTTDEIANPCDLGIRLWLNGELMQDSRTNQFIWDIPYLVNFLSTSFTLEPGDIVATGTPGGVGFVRQPPVFMHPGDHVRIVVEGLGALENEVVGETVAHLSRS